jgi:predicted nucleotidyltransferase
MIVELLPDLRFAYVFGSAARGELGSHSDYDVAVDAGRALDVTEILRLSGRLESVVGRKVDLVDLNSAGPVLKMQILQNGQLNSRRDRRALAEFQMYTPSQYEDWKHLSKPLDEALIRRFQQ